MNQFPGWEPPLENWSKLPHALISMLPDLTFAELKVTLYILRHTWGFGNYSEYISLSVDEIRFGRKGKDSRRLDNGTGLSKQSVLTGLTKAIARNTMVVEINNTDRARIRKSYKLRSIKIRPLESKNLTSEVQNLDLDHNKETLKENNSPTVKKSNKKRTERAVYNEAMENKFSVCTGIPLPSRNTAAQRRAAGNLWNTPLWAIYHMHRPDSERLGETKTTYNSPTLDNSLALIEASVDHMRKSNLTISSPKSIVSVAISLFGQGVESIGGQEFWEKYK